MILKPIMILKWFERSIGVRTKSETTSILKILEESDWSQSPEVSKVDRFIYLFICFYFDYFVVTVDEFKHILRLVLKTTFALLDHHVGWIHLLMSFHQFTHPIYH